LYGVLEKENLLLDACMFALLHCVFARSLTTPFISAVKCAYLSLICCAVGVVLSIASTTSCEFFSVANRKESLKYGIWGRYKEGSGILNCVSYDPNQEIDSAQKAAQAMTILSPVFGALAMALLFQAEIRSHTDNVTTKLAFATVIMIAAAICQLFTFMILDSAVCTNNADLTSLLSHECPQGSGATVSIVSVSFFCAGYVCSMCTMKFDAAAEPAKRSAAGADQSTDGADQSTTGADHEQQNGLVQSRGGASPTPDKQKPLQGNDDASEASDEGSIDIIPTPVTAEFNDLGQLL
jgi:hypothetical protein